MTEQPQQALIILGMHRSGTSAIAGIVNKLGVEMGASLLPAEKGINEKGYWEHAKIVMIHDRLLQALHSSWDDIRPLPENWHETDECLYFKQQIISVLKADFEGVNLWALKDPRMCRLLPLWQDIFASLKIEAKYIHIFRHPLAVAQSIAKRDGYSLKQGIFLWCDHLIRALEDTLEQPSSFIFYDDLLDNWEHELNKVSAELKIAWSGNFESSKAEVDAFLTPSLRHHKPSSSDNMDLPKFAWRLFEFLQDAAGHGVDKEKLKDLIGQYRLQADLFSAWLELPIIFERKNIEELISAYKKLENSKEDLSEQIRAYRKLENSRNELISANNQLRSLLLVRIQLRLKRILKREET